MAKGQAGVFISHYSEEKSIALKLQAYLTNRLGDGISVFVSSDRNSIGGGRVWFSRIRESLKAAKVVIVLLSTRSLGQEWLLFEAGVGDGAGACVIPVIFSKLTFKQLLFPLAGFHARQLNDLEGIVNDIAREFGIAVPPPAPIPDFTDAIAAVEAEAEKTGVLIRPFLDDQPKKWLLNLWLYNRGKSAVHLVKVVITIPEAVLLDENWLPNIREVLNSEGLEENGKPYRVLIYCPPRDPRRSSPGVLPKVLARNDHLFLKHLQIELKRLDHRLLQEYFRWQVFSIEGDCEEHHVQFKDIPFS